MQKTIKRAGMFVALSLILVACGGGADKGNAENKGGENTAQGTNTADYTTKTWDDMTKEEQQILATKMLTMSEEERAAVSKDMIGVTAAQEAQYAQFTEKGYRQVGDKYFYGGIVKNTSDKKALQATNVHITAVDAEGKTLFEDLKATNGLQPGDQNGFFGIYVKDFPEEVANIEFTIDQGWLEAPSETAVRAADLKTEMQVEEDGEAKKIYGTVTNTSKEEVMSLDLILLLKRDGEFLIGDDVSLGGFQPGESKEYSFTMSPEITYDDMQLVPDFYAPDAKKYERMTQEGMAEAAKQMLDKK